MFEEWVGFFFQVIDHFKSDKKSDEKNFAKKTIYLSNFSLGLFYLNGFLL